jgi:hypothetical protein
VLTGKGGREGGRGAESYDHKNAWSSINHSIISALKILEARMIRKLMEVE